MLSDSKLIFLLFGILLWGYASLAQSTEIKFDHLTVDQGLPQNSVICIYQDSFGYLWFGTLDGLARFDGYTFTVYKNDPLNPNSLSHNSISKILEDKNGVLWIGADAYLNSLDLSKIGFSARDAVFTRYEKAAQLGLNSIGAIREDDFGNLWVGSNNHGLFKFDRQGKETVSYRFGPQEPAYRKLHKIEQIYVESESTFWVATRDGLVKFDVKTGKVTQYKHDPDDPKSLSHNNILSICDDGAGGLWIATYGGGVNQMVRKPDQNGHESIEFIRYQHDFENPNSLSSDLVRSVFYDEESKALWIGTYGGGLNKLNVEQQMFVHYRHNPNDPNTISSDYVYYLYKDRTGTFWVGTNGGGVNKFNIEKIKFEQHYEFSHPDSAGSRSVWAIYEDASGTLWVGTDYGLRPYHVPPDAKISMSETSPRPLLAEHQVRVIHEDPQGNFWLGTLHEGLAKWDRNKGTVTWFKHDPDNPNSLGSDYVYSIYQDRDGALWIGTNGGGLSKLIPPITNHKNGWTEHSDIDEVQFKTYPADTRNLGFTGGWVIDIHEDRDGGLWLGTWQRGLVKFNKQTEQMAHYLPDSTDSYSLTAPTVFCIHEDKKGYLWLGTQGGGLNKFDRQEQKFNHYTENDGLANNVIYGILEDDLGNLWLSTNQGLSRFNPQTETFKSYDVNDGLQSNEFNLGAYFKSPGGKLYFGGVNGFNSFYPTEDSNRQPPKVVLTTFNKFGKRVNFDKSLSDMEKIDLSYDDTFFSFEFVALHYKEPKKNRYAYKMDGFDKEWNYVGARREAIYTNLDPGHYTFRVKAANRDGVWNDEGAAVRVVIHPPFWERWWFYLTCVLLFSLVLLSLFRLKVRRIRAYERFKIQEQEALIHDFHDELGKEIANILMLGKALQTEAPELPSKLTDRLDRMINHADRLISEMRFFLREHNPKENTLYHLALHLKDVGDQLFNSDEVDFQLMGLSEEMEGVKSPLVWHQQLRKLFQEAMTNVAKHSGDCQNIILEFLLTGKQLQITLSDDGKAFNLEEERGGFGLKTMRERAEKLRGRLEIISAQRIGTTVRFIGKLP